MTTTQTEPKAKRPPDRITCGGCDQTWTGVSRAHCGSCHVTWSGLALFEQHRRRDTCLAPSEMAVGGEPLRIVDGIVRGPEMDESQKAARFGGAR